MGVSQVRIAQYENGKIEPKIETIDKISQVLGVPISALKKSIPMEEHKKTTEYKEIEKKLNLSMLCLQSLKRYTKM